jgi:hypothetical protein
MTRGSIPVRIQGELCARKSGVLFSLRSQGTALGCPEIHSISGDGGMTNASVTVCPKLERELVEYPSQGSSLADIEGAKNKPRYDDRD